MAGLYELQNGVGNKPDADKYMANWFYTLAMALGNYVSNPGLERWDGGTSFTNPADAASTATYWTHVKSGTSTPTADVTRESTTKHSGSYAMKFNITGAGSANSLLGAKQSFSNYSRFAGLKIAFGASVRAATAGKVRIKIYDGVSTASYSDYHSGGSTFESLLAVHTVNAAPTQLTVSIEITSDFTGAVYFDSVFLHVVPSIAPLSALQRLDFSTAMSDAVYEMVSTLFLPLTGGTMSGNIAMGTNKLTGLGAGSAAGNSVRYEQLKILQVVMGTSTTAATTTGNTFAASNLSVSITPTSSSNKVLLFTSFVGSTSNMGFTADYTFARGGTNIGAATGFCNFGGASAGTASIVYPVSFCYLDSPSTTSATTYDVRMRNESGGITVGVGSGSGTQIIIAAEVNGI